MTDNYLQIYPFKMLKENEQYQYIWDKGSFIIHIKEDGKTCSLYSLYHFYAEVVSENNEIKELRTFTKGHRLDAYAGAIGI